MSAAGERPVVVVGLLWAGLSLARKLGRAGVRVTGISFHRHDFGIRSRYLGHRAVVVQDDVRRRDEQGVAAVTRAAVDGPVVLVPERDDHVEFCLRNWDELSRVARLPMPSDPGVARRLRRKELLPEEAARAGVPAPRTVAVEGEQTIRALDLRPPYLIKPVEGQGFAMAFRQKVIVAPDRDDALRIWRRAHERGFATVIQELVPESHEHIWSLFTYIGRDGRPLATVTGRKVRQGPLRFGTSAIFEVRPQERVVEQGLRLLRSAGYSGFGHVEFAYDTRDREFKLLEVNTRMPMWAGVAMSRYFDIARIAYDDLCGRRPGPCRRFDGPVTWIFFAKDAWVAAQMLRRRELGPAGMARPYLKRRKVWAILDVEDPAPLLASVSYLRSRVA